MKQYGIIGCGRFGNSLAKTLSFLGNDVLVVDQNEDSIKEIAEHVTRAIQADATDENVLKSIGISNMDTVIIGIGGSIQSSVLVTILTKEAGVKDIDS